MGELLHTLMLPIPNNHVQKELVETHLKMSGKDVYQ
jgi:hypothetical protein